MILFDLFSCMVNTAVIVLHGLKNNKLVSVLSSDEKESHSLLLHLAFICVLFFAALPLCCAVCWGPVVLQTCWALQFYCSPCLPTKRPSSMLPVY